MHRRGEPIKLSSPVHSIAEVVQKHSLRAAVLLMPRRFMIATTSRWRALSRYMPGLSALARDQVRFLVIIGQLRGALYANVSRRVRANESGAIAHLQHG